MIFADLLNPSSLGDVCFITFIVICFYAWLIGSGIKWGADKAKEALKDKDVKDGIKLGLWWGRINDWWK
jgi:hypothetical protein